MTFASGAYGQLRYIVEQTAGVTPNAGNGVNLRMTSPTMKAGVSTTSSQEIAKHRMSTGLTRTDMNIDGGFNFELSGKEYDPFLEGLLGQAFVHYGNNGLGATFSMATTANKITASAALAGSSNLTTLVKGQWFKIVAPPAASAAVKEYFADKWFKVSPTVDPTNVEVTLDPSTPITGVGLMAATAGYALSASRIQNADSLRRSFTLEHALEDIAQYLPFTGMRANTMELSLDVGAIVTGSFGFVGQSHPGMVAASTLPGVPAESQSLEVMNAVADVGAIYEGGVSVLGSSASNFIKSVKLSITNNLRGQKAVGVFGNAGVGYGEFAVSGTVEMYVEDAVYYNKWLAGVPTSLAFGIADSAGNGYMIEMEKVQFKDGGLNAQGKEDAMLSLPFQASYNAATGRGIRITRAVAA